MTNNLISSSTTVSSDLTEHKKYQGNAVILQILEKNEATAVSSKCMLSNFLPENL